MRYEAAFAKRTATFQVFWQRGPALAIACGVELIVRPRRKAAVSDDEAAFLREYLEVAVARLQTLAERLEHPAADRHVLAGELTALAQELWQAVDASAATAGAEPLRRAA